MNTPSLPRDLAAVTTPIAPDHPRAAATALGLFMGVATVLFALFIVAYAMRMDAGDWSPLALPWQLWLSTGVLVAGSGLMQRAANAAALGKPLALRGPLLGGGIASAAFLGSQLWGWQVMIDARVLLAGNPAASFFYVLTALHGLHVLGGLVAWSVAAQALSASAAELPAQAWRVRLCARYWHFLLAVWAMLFLTLATLTPEIVRIICGRS